jgi:8-hydroxy-5-deazaflavin:NADPH oxidoreductase
MKIGILGSGIVGQTLAAGLIKHGHQVKLGTRTPDDPDVKKWLASTPGATAGTFAEAAKFGDLVILAAKGTVVESVLNLAGKENLNGKTLLDVTNPIADAPPENGIVKYFTGPNESLGERVQALVPNAKVVKSFNSVGSGNMVNPHYEQGPPTMFLCGNDAQAKSQVIEIIKQFGWEPYDVGGITAARALEPLCMLWVIPGFTKNQWTHAFKLLLR